MRILATFLLLASLASSSFAQAPSRMQNAVAESASHDIQAVISAQIDAFRRNDGATALTYATPGLRAKFEDGPHFLEMVRTAYPTVFRPRSFAFTGLSIVDGGLQQKVELVGPGGEVALALYDMVQEPDRSWHIAGCALTRSEQLSL